MKLKKNKKEIEVLELDDDSNISKKDNKKKESKKNKKQLKKEKKVAKKQKRQDKKALKKAQKGKKNTGSIIVIIISIIFIILGILLSLIGGGVITIDFERKPKLYPLNEKVHIGDYVEYNAGVWDKSVNVPNRQVAYTFGGYTENASRNNSVNCGYNDVTMSGWRVFKIEDNSVILIQDGLSMCYYHGYGAGNTDRSLKILSGQDENFNFDYYLDNQFAESVKILSKEDIDSYYGSDTSYKKITDDLIKVGNPYWLASKNNTYNMWYVTEGGTVASNQVGVYGVRMLIKLKNTVKTIGQNDDQVWILTNDMTSKD